MTPNTSANCLDSLRDRLRQLEDIEAIRQLKYRYLNACDDKNPAQLLACFAPEKVDIDFGHIGVFDCAQGFVEVFCRMACHPYILDSHHAANPVIELTGPDDARGAVGLRFFSINTQDKTSTEILGRYKDGYRRIGGQWLIERSHFIVSTVEILDFSGSQTVVVHSGSQMPKPNTTQ